MQLHNPSAIRVFLAEESEDERLVLRDLLSCNGLSRISLFEYGVCDLEGCGYAGRILDTVVRYAAAVRRKEIHAVLQSLLYAVQARDLHTCCLSELFHINRELGLLDINNLVGTPCGDHGDVKALVRLDLLMILKRIDRIIRSAYELNIRHLHHAACRETGLGELSVAEIPYLFSCL